MPDFNTLGSLVRDLYLEFQKIYFLMLPVFFALAVLCTWVKNPQGSPDFFDVIKRAIISTLLLISFQEIATAIVDVCDGVADLIDNQSTLTTVIKMAGEKAHTYSASPKTLLLQFDDLFIATISFGSYLLLLIARYLTIGMYHFFWIFLSVIAPLALLFNLFPATSSITKNLFKGMVEVASWKIIWAILSAMLKSLSFGTSYAEGSYITLSVMNFCIAIALLATPLVVKSLIGSGLVTMATPMTAAMVALPAKLATVAVKARGFMSPAKQVAIRNFKRKPKA